jgi:hypothetical protein
MSSLPMWSYRYQPAYELMREANNRWDNNENQIGDENFLEACAIIYKHYDQSKDRWYNKSSPVSNLVKWSIDTDYEKRVKELHKQTQFAYDGYKY